MFSDGKKLSHLSQVVSNEVLLVAALAPQDHDAMHKGNAVYLPVGDMRISAS